MATKKSSSAISINPQTSLDSALADGDLSKTSYEIFVENLNPQTILGAQGVAPEDLVEDRVTLFVPVMDRSSSRAHEAKLMREEYNKMLDALKQSKLSDTILVSSWLFDSEIDLLHGFVSLEDADRLTSSNYKPYGSTAMYDAMLNALTSTVAYANSLQGYRVKVVLVLLTDGEDNESDSATLGKLQSVIKDLLAQERYVFAVVAFGQGHAQTSAKAMGIPSANVIEYGESEKDVRKAFALVSSSVIRQSQTQIGGSQNFFTP